MRQLVYVSSAVRLFTDQELAELLRVSRSNNERGGITGMLLYAGGNFIQAIEGPPDTVAALETRIGLDDRHRGIITLIDGPVEERSFPEWSMGFRRMETVLEASVAGQNEAFLPGVTPRALVAAPGRALTLLRSFRRTMN